MASSSRQVLNNSSSGQQKFVKIILYSQRDPESRTICKPKALYAEKAVLEKVEYFNERGFYFYFSRVHRVR